MDKEKILRKLKQEIEEVQKKFGVEFAEVKHGEWEEIVDLDGDSHWKCSACGCEWWFEVGGPIENGSYYCPNCGAKMDGERREQDV